MSGNSIREMIAADLELVLEWRNHIDVRRYMYTQHEISFAEHKSWFERCSNMPNRHLLIYEQEGVPLGFVNFNQINDSDIADWGFYAAPEAPKGTGRQLGQAALDFAFTQLQLHKICGQALSFNDRSINFHLSLGFRQEGVLRDQFNDGKQYHSVVCFGLLITEWRTIQEGGRNVK